MIIDTDDFNIFKDSVKFNEIVVQITNRLTNL